MMRKALLSLALVAIATPAFAVPKPATKAKPPTKAQLETANDTLKLIVSALQSKDVPQETKNGLFVCMYENPLKTLAHGEAAVLVHDKSIDANDPTQRLIVLARLCNAPIPRGAKAAPKGR